MGRCYKNFYIAAVRLYIDRLHEPIIVEKNAALFMLKMRI